MHQLHLNYYQLLVRQANTKIEQKKYLVRKNEIYFTENSCETLRRVTTSNANALRQATQKVSLFRSN